MRILAGLLALELVMNLSPLVRAESSYISLSSKLPARWDFEPPEQDFPDARESGSTRCPDCIEGQQNLITLVPTSQIGKTVAEYPTFFWYLPPASAKAMKFVLMDDKDEREIYSTTLAISPKQHGIMSLQLPASKLPPLQIGHKYLWMAVLICRPEDESKSIVAGGLVERVAPSAMLARQSKTTNLEQRLALYAESHLWYDTVSTLAELHRLHPQEKAIAQAWTKLLKSVELDNIAQEPVVVQSLSLN